MSLCSDVTLFGHSRWIRTAFETMQSDLPSGWKSPRKTGTPRNAELRYLVLTRPKTNTSKAGEPSEAGMPSTVKDTASSAISSQSSIESSDCRRRG